MCILLRVPSDGWVWSWRSRRISRRCDWWPKRHRKAWVIRRNPKQWFVALYSARKNRIAFVSSFTAILLTCKCQNKNVNISPIPNPMNHETNKNDPHFKLAKYFNTVIHSGIFFVVWAKILVWNVLQRILDTLQSTHKIRRTAAGGWLNST